MSSGCPGVYACENDTGKGLVVGLRTLPPTLIAQLRPGPPNDLNRTNGPRFQQRHASQPEPAQRGRAQPEPAQRSVTRNLNPRHAPTPATSPRATLWGLATEPAPRSVNRYLNPRHAPLIAT